MKKILLTLGLLGGLLGSVALQAFPVNVNDADAKKIAKGLFGIGKVKSEAIVAFREKHGRFESVDALERVKGISKKLVNKNREDILLSNE